MKKINNYSAQYKIISHSYTAQPAQLHSQNHAKTTAKPHKKKLSKDRQEFINNISASGFKQFQA